jgi:peptidoglycan/xylan/chitin deacetylase (PgdA/CDA1 family)
MKRFVRQSIRRGLASLLPRRLYSLTGRKSSKCIALTFDDGPDPVYTPALLDALRREGAAATFFVIGLAAEKHPELVKRMIDEGHEVGNHTWSHCDGGAVNSKVFLADVESGFETLRKVAGREIKLFRPPFGRISASALVHLWKSQKTVVLWNRDPKDYEANSRIDYVDRIRGVEPQGGDIVLLHDTNPNVVDGLNEVISASKNRGLNLATVSQVCGIR